MLEFEFISFLAELLEQHSEYSNVLVEPDLSPSGRVRPDIIANRTVNGESQLVVIECKSFPTLRKLHLRAALKQLEMYGSLKPRAKLVLAFPGRIPSDDYMKLLGTHVEVWDIDYISRVFIEQIKHAKKYSGVRNKFDAFLAMAADVIDQVPRYKQLLKELDECQPGKGHWSRYQKFIGNVLDYLFVPGLDSPMPETSDNSGANRRDFVLPNYAESGFWRFLRSRYDAEYIVVDAKNYKKSIPKESVLQISNYLKPHGVGRFAMIMCRKGAGKRANETIREQWGIYRKMVLVLSDEDVKSMIMAKSGANDPSFVLKGMIGEFRMSF